MGEREESVQPAAQMSQEQREIGMAYPQDCLWAPIQFLHQGWLEKKCSNPLVVSCFSGKPCCYLSFFQKKIKFLRVCQPSFLQWEREGGALLKGRKKTAGQIEHWVTARYWQAGAGYIFSAFLTIFLARLRHRWRFLVVATGMKPDECPFAVHDPVELPGPCVNSGTKAFHRILGKSSVCWVRSGAGSLLPAVEARWPGRGSVGLFADCA